MGGLGVRARTAITLAVLVVLVLAAVTWGFSRVTAPFDEADDATDAGCVDRTFSGSDRVQPRAIVVSVLNASSRGGLAGTTLDDFTAAGFAEGEQGNAPDDADVRNVQIWASNPKNPAVRLVRTYLGRGTPVRDREVDEPGVVVVIGSNFGGLREGRNAVRANGAFSICVPSAVESDDPAA